MRYNIRVAALVVRNVPTFYSKFQPSSAEAEFWEGGVAYPCDGRD